MMSKVKIDWTECTGHGTCADNCPVSVFEFQNLAKCPDLKKVVPV